MSLPYYLGYTGIYRVAQEGVCRAAEALVEAQGISKAVAHGDFIKNVSNVVLRAMAAVRGTADPVLT